MKSSQFKLSTIIAAAVIAFAGILAGTKILSSENENILGDVTTIENYSSGYCLISGCRCHGYVPTSSSWNSSCRNCGHSRQSHS